MGKEETDPTGDAGRKEMAYFSGRRIPLSEFHVPDRNTGAVDGPRIESTYESLGHCDLLSIGDVVASESGSPIMFLKLTHR